MTENTISNAPKENKMGVMPIPKLIITMALPMMISMLVQALYNVVDSLFVARIGENALTALSMAFPVQNMMIAVASGTGVGMNALISRYLGERNEEHADRIAQNGYFLAGVSALVFLLFGLFGARAFMETQTKSLEIITYGTQYLQVVCGMSFGLMFQMIGERILQSTGKTIYTMFTQGTGAIINIILDPCMIFGLGFFPKMGVTGAALATVIGQIVAMIMAFYFNKKKNTELHVTMKGFRPELSAIGKIYSIGFPSIIMIAIASVMTYTLNKILVSFTTTAVAVFGVYFKVQSFAFMPVFGLNNGMVPIVGYNYGAKNGKRIVETIRSGIGYAVGIMLVIFLLVQIFPAQIMGMFDASAEMTQIGVVALRTISLCFLLAGFNVICGSVFQALGHGMASLWVSIIRQLCVLLPAALILSKTVGLVGCWIAFPVAEVAGLIVSVLFMRRVYRQEIKPICE